MGYTAHYFDLIAHHWLGKGWVVPPARLVEFGAQEFTACDPDEARRRVDEFLAGLGKPSRYNITPGGYPCVASVYRAVGIDYTAIDVDGAHGSAFFDLNCFAPPSEWRAAFDIVNNEGTIEHLVNPVNGFQVAHELLKVGGVAVHSMPLSGWPHHGLFYATPKFYALLVGTNDYEFLHAEVEMRQARFDLEDPRFVLVGIAPGTVMSDLWIRIAYRKRHDAAFRVPADHLYVDDPKALAERLDAEFAAYSGRRKIG